jgi:hypothetical protein
MEFIITFVILYSLPLMSLRLAIPVKWVGEMTHAYRLPTLGKLTWEDYEFKDSLATYHDPISKMHKGWEWWLMPLFSALRRQRHGDP